MEEKNGIFDPKQPVKSDFKSSHTSELYVQKIESFSLPIADQALIASWLIQKGKKTQVYYKRIVFEFFRFFPQTNLNTVQITHLALFLKTYKKFSDSTRNTYKNALSSLFGFAFKTGYIAKNPAAALENLKVPDRIYSKVLSHEQIQQMILKESSKRNQMIFKIFYYTGIRVDELCKLRKKSFQIARIQNFLPSNKSQTSPAQTSLLMLVEGKGRKVRSVHIPEHLAEELHVFMQKLDSDQFLFRNERLLDFGLDQFGILEDFNNPLSASQVFRIVKAAAKRAGLSVAPSPHWLRHTSATHAIEAGAPIHVVQKSLGHESISTTGKYLDLRPKESVGNYLKKIV